MMTNLAPGPRSLHQGEMTTIGWHSYHHVVLGCVLFEPVPSMPRIACLSVSLCMSDTENMMPIRRAAGPHAGKLLNNNINNNNNDYVFHLMMS